MASSLFGNNKTNNNVIDQFNQFKQSMVGKDPKAIVMNLLSTGRMSQQQYEQITTELRKVLR